MGDTAEGSWGSRELGGFIRREESRIAFERNREVRIATLSPGDEFSLKLETTGRSVEGKVVKVNMGSVTVEIPGLSGEHGTVMSGGRQNWCLDTFVIPKLSS